MKDMRPARRGTCDECKQPKLVRDFNFRRVCEECENDIVDRMVEADKQRQEGLAYSANQGAKKPRE